MKPWKAYVEGGDSFAVIGRTYEAAYAEAVNVTALLFIQFGLVLRIQKVVEA